MKAFIIIVLALSIIRSFRPILKYAEKDDAEGVIANLAFLICAILALIFACVRN